MALALHGGARACVLHFTVNANQAIAFLLVTHSDGIFERKTNHQEDAARALFS